MPWELIGYATSNGRPFMWLRAIVKVAQPQLANLRARMQPLLSGSLRPLRMLRRMPLLRQLPPLPLLLLMPLLPLLPLLLLHTPRCRWTVNLLDDGFPLRRFADCSASAR